MSDLLKDLNPEQRLAVTLPAAHALVLAGAGSGKTRVLTTRIAWLIQTGQIGPLGILAVTFTNKASREMATRLAALLPINIRNMWIGTFHGLCNRLLRAHYREAGLPQTFQILDTQDQFSAIKRLLKQQPLDEEKYPPKQLQWFINANKEQGLRPDQVQQNDQLTRTSTEFYRAYEAQCQREGVVDFPELLLRCYELLKNNVFIREHYQQRFRHLLVDEFQDTNTLQYAWLQLLAGGGASIFAVGDDDQSIYAFRGANTGNMLQFEQQYAHDRLIKLEQNYRSYAHILSAANALIRQNSKRLGKELWTERGVGEPVRVFEAKSDGQEAQWVVEEIHALLAQDTLRREIALLYRSNAQSRVLEHALFSAGIPYRVYGGLRFFERQEIKHALAYLRLMENPHDDTSFMRVVNFPARGIGARTLEQLQDIARLASPASSLYSAVLQMAGKAASNLAQFLVLIDRLRSETQGKPLPEIVEHVIHRSGLITHYKNDKEGQDRIENLHELVNAALAFRHELINEDAEAPEASEATTPNAQDNDVFAAAENGLPSGVGQYTNPELAGFLTHASLEAGDNQALDGQDALQLMTIHAAKGLEFQAVFVTGLEKGLFPHENSLNQVDGLEEERRLMYVAMTRARQRLYLSYAQTRLLHGQTRYHMRSTFFDELPKENLRWLTPNVRAQIGDSQRAFSHSAYGNATAGKSATNTPYWRTVYSDKGSPASQPPPGWAKPSETADSSGRIFRIGQAVAHNKFGEGIVLAIEGRGQDARIHVNFGRHGQKWLALNLAKLTAV